LEEIIEKYLLTTDPIWLKLHPKDSHETVSGEVAVKFSFEGKLDPERDPIAPVPVKIGGAIPSNADGDRKDKKAKRTTPPRGKKLTSMISRATIRGSEGYELFVLR